MFEKPTKQKKPMMLNQSNLSIPSSSEDDNLSENSDKILVNHEE